jgi:hypothetical protein
MLWVPKNKKYYQAMTKYDNVELIKFLRGQHWLLMSEREQAEAFANALEAQDKSDSEPSSGEPEYCQCKNRGTYSFTYRAASINHQLYCSDCDMPLAPKKERE